MQENFFILDKILKAPYVRSDEGHWRRTDNQDMTSTSRSLCFSGKADSRVRKACGITKEAADPRESGPSPDAENKLTG